MVEDVQQRTSMHKQRTSMHSKRRHVNGDQGMEHGLKKCGHARFHSFKDNQSPDLFL